MFSKFRSLVFKINPETAHNLAIKSLKFNLVKNIFDSNKDAAMFHTVLFGKKIKNPIGIAAGFDKNAEVYNPLFKLGFGLPYCSRGVTVPTSTNPNPNLNKGL